MYMYMYLRFMHVYIYIYLYDRNAFSLPRSAFFLFLSAVRPLVAAYEQLEACCGEMVSLNARGSGVPRALGVQLRVPLGLAPSKKGRKERREEGFWLSCEPLFLCESGVSCPTSRLWHGLGKQAFGGVKVY